MSSSEVIEQASKDDFNSKRNDLKKKSGPRFGLGRLSLRKSNKDKEKDKERLHKSEITRKEAEEEKKKKKEAKKEEKSKKEKEKKGKKSSPEVVIRKSGETAPESPTGAEYGTRESRKRTLESKLLARPGEQVLLQRGVIKRQRNIPVFAVPLGHVMYTSYTEFDLPMVFEQGVAYLRNKNRLQLEGLFRVSGAVEEIKKFKQFYDEGKDIDFEQHCTNPHSVTGLLKLFFRELPDPLLTHRAYDLFIGAINESKDPEDRMRRMKIALGHIPPHHALLLEALLKFLREVSSQSQKNLMSTQNLGIVFGPTLLKKKELDMDVISTVPSQVVEFLLDEMDALFKKPERAATVSNLNQLTKQGSENSLKKPERSSTMGSIGNEDHQHLNPQGTKPNGV